MANCVCKYKLQKYDQNHKNTQGNLFKRVQRSNEVIMCVRMFLCIYFAFASHSFCKLFPLHEYVLENYAMNLMLVCIPSIF
jgi:hypothetical protein